MTRFRGCIDIHSGSVKQIVGGTLTEDDHLNTNSNTDITPNSSTSTIVPQSSDASLATNFVSNKPSSYYSLLYKESNVTGTHVIKLGSNPANDEVAKLALSTWAKNLQIGGGINIGNAQYWLDQGASHVIITSWLFPNGEFSLKNLKELAELIVKDRIVVDLSCRRIEEIDDEGERKTRWFVAINKWQTMTKFELNRKAFEELGQYCDEFLVHAADVEGLCKGIDEELVQKLSEWCDFPITYAGGAKDVKDLARVEELSNGKVDLTYGSALDIFGGDLVKFQDCVAWNEKH